MKIKTIGSLFSGIGGLELGLERALTAMVSWQVELDEKCRRVLARHWPNADRSITDVRTANATNLARVDLLCGGFPCQDVSSAGKGAGLTGARSGLWYDFARIAKALSPPWIVVENVASGARRWLPHVRRDLHVLGYRTRVLGISAFDVGAPHRRERVFVLAADPNCVELRDEQGWSKRPDRLGTTELVHDGAQGIAPNADRAGELQPSGPIRSFWRWSRNGCGKWTVESPVSGVAHGLPGRVDRERQLGNSVNVEQAHAIGRVISSYG